jgi:mRNA-degrading endonuclease toxin of MazEF toxin-antitoxin module
LAIRLPQAAVKSLHVHEGEQVELSINGDRAGRMPALMLSPGDCHAKTVLAVVCPITSNTTPDPFEVLLSDGLSISGAVLADQVKSIDRAARHLTIAGPAPEGRRRRSPGQDRGAARYS